MSRSLREAAWQLNPLLRRQRKRSAFPIFSFLVFILLPFNHLVFYVCYVLDAFMACGRNIFNINWQLLTTIGFKSGGLNVLRFPTISPLVGCHDLCGRQHDSPTHSDAGATTGLEFPSHLLWYSSPSRILCLMVLLSQMPSWYVVTTSSTPAGNYSQRTTSNYTASTPSDHRQFRNPSEATMSAAGSMTIRTTPASATQQVCISSLLL